MTTNSSKKIDVHFHMLPEFYTKAVGESGRIPSISIGFPTWTPELSLERMDRQAIQTAFTSISTPGVHFGDDHAARKLARTCNDYAATLVQDWPTRFGGFATLPLPDVTGAREEVAYALDHLKLDGVCLLASYQERFLGDPWFDPVLEELNARDAVVFIHPNNHPTNRILNQNLTAPGFVIEYVFDTTRAVVNMLMNGTFQKFPRIRFILSHAGGTIPYVAWRVSVAPRMDNRLSHLTSEGVMQSLRGLWYDTALSAGTPAIAALKEVADPGRILFGADSPFCQEDIVGEQIKALESSPLLDQSEQDDIMRNNAVALFPRLASAF